MQFSKRMRQIIGWGIIIILIGFFIWYVSYLSVSYAVSPFLIPAQKTVLPINLVYPPITNGTLQNAIFQINFTLTSNTIIAEKTNIKMTYVSGKLFNQIGALNPISPINSTYISDVFVGFPNTFPNAPIGSMLLGNETIQGSNITVQNQQYYEGLDYLWLVHWSGFSNFTSTWNITFNFPVSGNYWPSIIVLTTHQYNVGNIFYKNNTATTYTYNQIQIPVISSSQVQSEELEQIGGFVGVALYFFAVVEIFKLVVYWIKDAPKKAEENKPFLEYQGTFDY